MAFRIQISRGEGFDDTFYFNNLPKKDELIKAIERNREIADKAWEPDYDMCINGIEETDKFPSYFPKRLAMSGFAMKNGCSIAIWQFKFED